LIADHATMMVMIPPKYVVFNAVDSIKGISAMHLARFFGGCKWSYTRKICWTEGYFVLTEGRDEKVIWN